MLPQELGITLGFRTVQAMLKKSALWLAKVTSDKDAKCKVGDVIVQSRPPATYRPTEVETLLGDPSKAKAKLGWVPTTTLDELVKEMVLADYTAARRDSLVKMAGFQAYDYNE